MSTSPLCETCGAELARGENVQWWCPSCNDGKTGVARSIQHASPVAQAGFVMIQRAVFFDSSLSIGARMLYGAFKSFAWQAETCWPGLKLLAEQLGVNERTVRNYVSELVEAGLISVHRRGLGMTNRYIIHEPKPKEVQQSFLHGSATSSDQDRTETIGEVEAVEVEERTPFSIETENSVLSANGHKRDFIFEAFAHYFGEPATKAERGCLNAAVLQVKPALIAAGIDLSDEMLVRHEVWVRYGQAQVSFENFGPMALAKNWGQLEKRSREFVL